LILVWIQTLYDKLGEIPLDKRPPDNVLDDFNKYIDWLIDYMKNDSTRECSNEKYDKYGSSFRRNKRE